jgi:molecular chaperone DnaJ
MAVQREWFEKDYYAILGVSKTATAKEITSAYRKLARQFHPDANPDDRAAEDRFKEISAAYEVVGDEERRKEYDQARAIGPMGGGPMGGGMPNGGMHFEGADLGDLLGNLFGRGPGGQPRTPRAERGPRRGDDLQTELHLSFDDAVRGATTTVNLTSEVTCPDCNGSGAAHGTAPKVCPDCGGRGAVDDNQGMFSFSHPCETCRGRGSYIERPCTTCQGSGITVKPRTVRVKIPAGVKDGQQIRLKGKGSPGRNNGPAGDLYVRVSVGSHPIFGRDGKNLTVRVPVSYPDAALGADVPVPTLEGDSVRIRIPAGTPHGRIFRVRGRGVGSGDSAGDLLATIEVAVPAELTDDQRATIEQLRTQLASVPVNGES